MLAFANPNIFKTIIL